MIDAPLPAELRAALARPFRNIVVFSGAGMSEDSGIPTFRSGSNGLWHEFNPADLATPDAWRRDRETVWGWYEWRRGLVMRAEPNAGHLAVARLQRELGAHVITQNVDDLHERAGAHGVLHLHGSLFAPRCSACARPHGFDAAPPETPQRRRVPPRCSHCGGYVRPGVVWFGESLDAAVLGQAQALVSRCDLLLVVGTSGVVYPAAGLVDMAPKSALVVSINPDCVGSEPGTRIDYAMRSRAATGLPQITGLLVKGEESNDLE
ncbi:MAG TPA: NAD-dependent deacylase [Rhodocyclaceae bacterium]|nr:NAD-dependent deacylase [Rhodocyclaceae bacterium]